MNYSVWRNVRLGTFQIGSAMGEILTASVWNRIMISELGMPATPVGLLLVLQYVLLPISLWVGDRSDRVRFLGRRRSSYIWAGRSAMVIAFPILGLSIVEFNLGQNVVGWTLATIAFLMFGVGKLASGSVFLALVRESAPPDKRGVAIAIVETTLIALFPVMAILFGRFMETFSVEAYWRLTAITAICGAFFWWFAIAGAEQNAVAEAKTSGSHDFRQTLRLILTDQRTRAFFIFLGLATFAAWMQDNILEPFGDDVFELPVGVTTRFTGYWGGATVIVLLTCFGLLRKQRPETQGRLTQIGLFIMGLGMIMLAGESYGQDRTLLIPSLLVFGGGFGLYTFGGLSLMAVMSPSRNAGAYLGLWTTCILLTKGAGTFAGSALRDLFGAQMPFTSAYALIFGVAAFGLIVSAFLVTRIDYIGFAAEHETG